jgi:hypothetical protein
MQMRPTNPTLNVRVSGNTSQATPHRESSSRITSAGVALLSHESTPKRIMNTQEDIRACDTNMSRRGLSRNQGVIDKRCKAVRGRLYAKVQQRKIQRMIDQLDALMEKLLESQDPANEKLYDLYAERKAQLETQL